MVRTHGPWRCVFSKAGTTAPPPASRKPRDDAGVIPPKQEEVPASLTRGADLGNRCRDNNDACDGGARRDAAAAAAALQPGRRAVDTQGVTRSSRCGEDDAAAAATAAVGIVRGGGGRKRGVVTSNGNGSRVGSDDAVMSEAGSGESGAAGVTAEGTVVDVGGDNHGVDDGAVGGDVDAAAELGEEGEEYFVYVNMVTGEVTREPPTELVARSEEAEQAGDFLIFVPSHSFVGAAASASASASNAATVAAVASSASQAWKLASQLASATAEEAFSEDACGGGSPPGDKLGEECGAERGAGGGSNGLAGDSRGGDGYLLTAVAASTPPEAAHVARQHNNGSSGTSGGEAWHRLGSLSEPGMTPAASRQPLDTGTSAGAAANAANAAAAEMVATSGVGTPPVGARPAVSGSAPTAGGVGGVGVGGGDPFALTIDLSEASAVAAASLGAGEKRRAGNDCTVDGLAVAPGEAGAGAGAGAGAAEVGGWACSMCTLKNAMKVRRCEVCSAPKPKSLGLQV